MQTIFKTKDKTKRIIYLTKEGWKHILQEHPYLFQYLEKIKETINKPLQVKQSTYDESVQYFYKWLKERKKYLLVAVKYLNGTGFVITSFYMRNLKK
jgi:hypothetical protein